jgi:hypothetical protein
MISILHHQIIFNNEFYHYKVILKISEQLKEKKPEKPKKKAQKSLMFSKGSLQKA